MKQQGLTILEVLIAIAILGVVAGVLTTSLVGSMRHNATSGQRTQAAQVLSYLGRRAAGGDAEVLAGSTSARVWDYGDLPTAFTDLAAASGFADPAAYRASVTNMGSVTLATVSAVQYRIEVCWMNANDETCITGDTLGPESNPGGGASAPPVVN